MSLNDILGLATLFVLFLFALYGLNRISRPAALTQEEYERRLKQSSGLAAGAMNALMYPLQELANPKAAEAVQVIKDMTEGHYDVKQESGDDKVPDVPILAGEQENTAPTIRRRTGTKQLIRRAIRLFRRETS